MFWRRDCFKRVLSKRPSSDTFHIARLLSAIVSQNSFRAFFSWGIAQLSRDTLQNGVSHRCACVNLSTKGGGLAPLWGIAGMAEKVSRDRGIAAILSQYRAIWGH